MRFHPALLPVSEDERVRLTGTPVYWIRRPQAWEHLGRPETGIHPSLRSVSIRNNIQPGVPLTCIRPGGPQGHPTADPPREVEADGGASRMKRLPHSHSLQGLHVGRPAEVQLRGTRVNE